MDNLESIKIIPLESLPKYAFLNGKAVAFTLTDKEVEALKNYQKKSLALDDNDEMMEKPFSKSR